MKEVTVQGKSDYLRGWIASGGSYMSLDAADKRGESNEWYDGYSDRANNEKWHRLLCDAPSHDECEPIADAAKIIRQIKAN